MNHRCSEQPVWVVDLDENAGPAQPLPEQRAQAMARAAVRSAMQPSATVRRPLFWAIAAAAIMFGGGAMAAVGVWVIDGLDAAPAATQRALDEPSQTRRQSHAARPTLPSVPAPAALEDTAQALPDGAESKSLIPPQNIRGSAPTTPDGDRLLVLANQARASGKFARALRLYRQAVSSSNRRVVAVALVAEAALTLDHSGHPGRALKLYRQALRRSHEPALSAVARHGMAQCFRALNKTALERNTLREFLELYPDHWLATQAATRMRVLGSH